MLAMRAQKVTTSGILGVGFLLVFLLLCLASVELFNIREKFRAGVDPLPAATEGLQSITRVRVSIASFNNIMKDYAISGGGNDGQVIHSRVEATRDDLSEAIQALSQNPLIEKQTKLLDERTQRYLNAVENFLKWPSNQVRHQAAIYLSRDMQPIRNGTAMAIRDTERVLQGALDAASKAQLEARRQSFMRLLGMIVFAVFVAIFLAMMSLIYSRNLERASNRKLDELRRAGRALEQLSARLMNVQEEERRRLSRELHDGIGGTLTALRIEVSRARTLLTGAPEGLDRLKRAHSLAEEAVHTIRDISVLLRPPQLDDLGLDAAIRWLADEFTKRTAIPCQYSVEAMRENLPDAWKTCVYRIVQETLHNTEKHAMASLVRIRMEETQQFLLVQIEDDGRGFVMDEAATSDSRTGLGLLGMRERAQMLGGTLTIDSAPGHGTKVSVRLPVSPTSLPALKPKSAEALAG